MSEMDYEKVGFKAGLEIHQQLDTRKLFCNCPSILRTDEPEFVIKRKLNAVAGESGEIDVAAKFEKSKNKEFFYQGYSTTCLIELDEEPPREINRDALKTALQLAELLNCNVLPITQIMRKTVVDGSNTSGFQRTVLLAINGFLETSRGKVRIQSICLEEDAARIVEKNEHSSIYRLDRLGIPLVEIATEPDLKDAEHVKETALKLGEILRSCKVRRGIGTIRQDVNVSIKGGARIEIKGFQDPSMMIKIVDNEILRQKELVEQKIKVVSEVRNALPDGNTEFMRPMPGADRMYPETDLPLLKISRDMMNEVKKNLPKLTEEIQGDLKNQGLSQEMTKLLLGEKMLDEFKALLNLYNHPNFVVKVLILWPKEIASRNKLSIKQKNERFSVDVIESILHKVAEKKISEVDVKRVLERLGEGVHFDEIIKTEEKKEKIEVNAIEERILKLMKEKPGLNANAYMGLMMKDFAGRVDGKTIMEAIKKFVK